MFACAKASGRGRKVHRFQQCFQFLEQREQSIILRSLSCVWICRNPPKPHLAEHRAAGTDHGPRRLYGWFPCSLPQPTTLGQFFHQPEQEQSRPNSSRPSGVLNSPLRFLKIPFQATSFVIAFPLVNHHQPPKLSVPSTGESPTKRVCWISQQFVTQYRLFLAVHWKIPNIIVQIVISRNNRWGDVFDSSQVPLTS